MGAYVRMVVAALVWGAACAGFGCHRYPRESGTWSGHLVSAPAASLRGAESQRWEVTKLKLDADSKVPSDRHHPSLGGYPLLLVGDDGRALLFNDVVPGGPVKVHGTYTWMNVRAPVGESWICGPPPRGLWDSRLTCPAIRVKEITRQDGTPGAATGGEHGAGD